MKEEDCREKNAETREGRERRGRHQEKGTHLGNIQWLDTWECHGENEELDNEKDDAREQREMHS